MTAYNRMLPTDLQETAEYHFSRKHIDNYIRKHIDTDPGYREKVEMGVKILEYWCGLSFFERKQKLVEQVKQLDLNQMVKDIFLNIAYFQRPELMVSVCAQIADAVGFNDRKESLEIIGSIVAMLCQTDAFDISKEHVDASLYLVSTMPLPKEILDAIDRAHFIPPMVCEPTPVTSNFESPYLTFNESRILGKKKGHNGDICLDVLNIQTAVPLQLDVEFLRSVEEKPTHDLDTMEKQQLWADFIRQSNRVYLHLIKSGNTFWLDNHVDNRGRMYAHGYHVTTQGTSYKKAMIELSHEEIVEGVPNAFQL